MGFLNTTVDEEQLRKEYQLLCHQDTVRVQVKARRHGKSWLPDADGDHSIWAKLRRMDVGDFWMIERFTTRTEEIDGKPIVDYDGEEMKRQILRFQLLDWNMGVPLTFDDSGRLTEECWKVVMQQPAPLVDALVTEYQSTYIVTMSEEQKIDRQCAVLFSPKTRGVDDACEAVTLFCVLGNMWEKFGINRFQIKKLPYREYVMLRMVLQREIDHRKAQTGAKRRRDAVRIAGPGGRTRPSRGITIENP